MRVGACENCCPLSVTVTLSGMPRLPPAAAPTSQSGGTHAGVVHERAKLPLCGAWFGLGLGLGFGFGFGLGLGLGFR